MEYKRPRIRPDLAGRIEKARGDVPFDRWVNRLIEAFFADTNEPMERLVELSAIQTIRNRPAPEL